MNETMNRVYKCTMTCFWKDRLWTEDEIYKENDKFGKPNHHFELIQGELSEDELEVVKLEHEEPKDIPINEKVEEMSLNELRLKEQVLPQLWAKYRLRKGANKDKLWKDLRVLGEKATREKYEIKL